MMSFSLTGTLPVPMNVLDGQQALKIAKVELVQLNVSDSLSVLAKLQPDQFVAVGEMAAMMELIDVNGKRHEVTYEMLSSTSRQNWDYLQQLRGELDAKEREAAN